MAEGLSRHVQVSRTKKRGTALEPRTNSTTVNPYMSARQRFNTYQTQAILSASPEQLIVKLYDLGISACHRGDRYTLRAVLRELISALDLERGGELAGRLYALYAFCMDKSASGGLDPVAEILEGLREAWKKTVVTGRAA